MVVVAVSSPAGTHPSAVTSLAPAIFARYSLLSSRVAIQRSPTERAVGTSSWKNVCVFLPSVTLIPAIKLACEPSLSILICRSLMIAASSVVSVGALPSASVFATLSDAIRLSISPAVVEDSSAVRFTA